MSDLKFTITVPHGTVSYRLRHCDNCGIDAAEPEKWYEVAEFFHRWNFRITNENIVFDAELLKGACSPICLEILIAPLLPRFFVLLQRWHDSKGKNYV